LLRQESDCYDATIFIYRTDEAVTIFLSGKLLHPIILIGLLLIASPAFADDVSLPVIGAEGSLRMSAQEEMQLGEAFMRRLRQELDIIEDPQLQEYISGVGFRLVSNSDFNRRHFQFFLVNDATINAFAGPAGYIGVNAGLILEADNEAELAAVVAHEIAHVGQNHLERTFEAAEKLSIPTAAALVAAIILGAQEPNLAEAALAATLAANIQTQLNFTRNHEVEADHIGMQILAQSHFNPQAMPSFFEKLLQSDRLYDSEMPEFLRTHPVTTNRIAESRARASQYKTQTTAENINFQLAKAKLRVLTHKDKKKLIQELEAQLDEGSYQHEISQRYSYALALLDTRQYAKARKQINQVLKMDRSRLPYIVLTAEIELADGKVGKGLRILRDGLELHPGSPTVSRALAQALLQNDQAKDAQPILKAQAKREAQPETWHMLAQAEGQLGQQVASHQALAEYYFLKGFTHVAIDQLRLAMKVESITDTEKHVVGQRLKELRELALLERQLL
jgi:predicted Zn-dependent protease